MITLSAQRHDTTTDEEPRTSSALDTWRIRTARERLSTLLEEAAELDLDDAPAWAHLRATAHATTTVLCAASLLPRHLHVRHDDPPIVVARTIAAAVDQDRAVIVARHRSLGIPGQR